jgi:vacuolar-type H+-ATPase subunit I/STV1
LPHQLQGPDVTPADYSNLYNDIKSWVDKTTEIAKNRDFPNSVSKLKKGIEKLEKIRSHELPTRKSDLDNLSEMADTLEAHRNKHPEAEGVPADKNLGQLKNVCSLYA